VYKKSLRFDFYLEEFNTSIEIQGKQHYEPVDFGGRPREWSIQDFKIQQIRDQIKRDYCKENNIKLLEIPYWDFDNIEQILDKTIRRK
jgi:hypothetical protein